MIQVYMYILDITGFYEHVIQFQMEMKRITKFNFSANVIAWNFSIRWRELMYIRSRISRYFAYSRTFGLRSIN